MSLKHFHIIFIASSAGLMGFLAYWSGQRAFLGDGSWLVVPVFSAGLAGGLAYLRWFLSRHRALR